MIRSVEPTAPLSRILVVATLADGPVVVPIEASEVERVQLARLNRLPSVLRFEARFRVLREGRTGVHVTGKVSARVRQICVVTLDPFDSDIAGDADVHFRPEAELATLAPAGAPDRSTDGVDDTDQDPPDPIVGGKIDLGALAAELLTLALDPYPRKPGVSYDEAPDAAAGSERSSPFAVLARVKSVGPPADE